MLIQYIYKGSKKKYFVVSNKGVRRMPEKKEKKGFVEPQLIKFEDSLDKVTMNLGGLWRLYRQSGRQQSGTLIWKSKSLALG